MFFAYNCLIHQEIENQSNYISKCHTLQNVKFKMSEYSNTTKRAGEFGLRRTSSACQLIKMMKKTIGLVVSFLFTYI